MNLYELLTKQEEEELTRVRFTDLRHQWGDGEIDDDAWQKIIDKMNDAGGYENLPED